MGYITWAKAVGKVLGSMMAVALIDNLKYKGLYALIGGINFLMGLICIITVPSTLN